MTLTKTLLEYELAWQNALEVDFAQVQAVNQGAEYDSKVELVYIDSITKFDVIDPYDGVNFQVWQMYGACNFQWKESHRPGVEGIFCRLSH